MPILPFKIQLKLLFALCKRCGENLNRDKCTCTEPQCSWLATATQMRFNIALKEGYTISKMYELLNYPLHKTVKFDKSNNIKGLFGSYIVSWLKVKEESSYLAAGLRE